MSGILTLDCALATTQLIQVTEDTINAETEDDLMAAEAMAQKTNVPEIQNVIVRIRTLSADEKRKETYDG